MQNLKLRAQSGFSLIEMLIVLVVIGIVVAFAVAQFGRSNDNLARQNLAREFKISLERARFDSVKRRATDCDDMSRVEITSATSFRLISDQNQNGTVLNGGALDPSDVRTVNFANQNQISIVGTALVFPIIYRFDQRGHVWTGGCPINTATPAPTTTFCNLPCTSVATADPSNSNIVFVSATGTSSILAGGETIPDFDDPDAANIDAATAIDNRLTVWNGTPITPTPLATTTPPTPTPLTSPGPSDPSDPPPPDPDPTPNACTYGQRVNGNPACTCYDPLKVVKNKCVGVTPTPAP